MPWIFLSGLLDAFHLILGVVSVSLVSIWSGKYFIPDLRKTLKQRFSELGKFIIYCGWLFTEIVKANFHVVAIAFSPRLEDQLNPQMITFKTTLKHDLPKFVLANSITLTPGTVTVRINDNEYLVHALTDHVAKSLPGEMEKKVASIFGKWA